MWCAVMSTGNIQRSCVLDGGPQLITCAFPNLPSKDGGSKLSLKVRYQLCEVTLASLLL